MIKSRKEYDKQYHENHRNKRLRQMKQYYKENYEEIRKQNNEYYKAHKEQISNRSRQYYKEHFEEKKEYDKQRIKEKYLFICNYKLSRGCSVCGYNKCASALDFHHKENGKEISVSQMIRKKGLKAIKEEIKKCEVLCANCHRELHEKLRNGGSSNA